MNGQKTLSNGNMVVTCEYCGREMANSQIRNHEDVCIHNPDMAESVKGCLHVLADGPFMPSRPVYDKSRLDYDRLPSSATLIAGLGVPTWDDVARWAGLRPESERLEYTLQELRRLSELHHDGLIAPSAGEWRTYHTPGAMLAESLTNRFGSWQNVVELAGLRYETRSYYKRKGLDRAANGDEAAAAYIEERMKMRDAFDWSAMPAIDRGERAVFDWRTMSYRLCHVMELR